MTDKIIKGKTWVGGDDIFAFDIIPKKRWTLDNLNPDDLGRWAMEAVDPEFDGVENGFKNASYTFIVAGKNFGGGGKSIEHPIMALKGAGVKVVLADSFARYNFRNSINNGVFVLECNGLSKETQKGDELIVNLTKGEVTNTRTGAVKHFKLLPDFVIEIIDNNGLLEYAKTKLNQQK